MEELNVRWDSHLEHLLKKISHQRDFGRFCDVTLACEGGRTLKAHRTVLCANSTYFNKIFSNTTSNTFDHHNIVIVLKDCKYADVRLILQFMYNGEINITHVSSIQYILAKCKDTFI